MARIKPQALLIQSKKKKSPARISLTTIIAFNLIIFLIILSGYATYKYWYRRSSYQPETNLNTFGHSEVNRETKKFDLPGYAIFNTAKGSIIAELYKDASPEVVDKFLDLCPKHEAFMLGTTKAKPDNKGFELFITTAPIPDLNDKLVVFGRVIKGEDVVQEIEEVDTDEHYRPKSPIGIIDITLKHEP